MQVVVVDGALENALADIQLNGVLRGLAPICPPTNAVIAFPCQPKEPFEQNKKGCKYPVNFDTRFLRKHLAKMASK